MDFEEFLNSLQQWLANSQWDPSQWREVAKHYWDAGVTDPAMAGRLLFQESRDLAVQEFDGAPKGLSSFGRNPELRGFFNRIDRVLREQEIAQKSGADLNISGALDYVAEQRHRADAYDLFGDEAESVREALDMAAAKYSREQQIADLAKFTQQMDVLSPDDIRFLKDLTDSLEKGKPTKEFLSQVFDPENFGYGKGEAEATMRRILNRTIGAEVSPIAKQGNTAEMEKWLKMHIPEIEDLNKTFERSGAPVVKNVAPRVAEVPAVTDSGMSKVLSSFGTVAKAVGNVADLAIFGDVASAGGYVRNMPDGTVFVGTPHNAVLDPLVKRLTTQNGGVQAPIVPSPLGGVGGGGSGRNRIQ